MSRVLTYAGSCEVHERFTAEEIRSYRRSMPDVQVIAHPECPPEVVDEADFSGFDQGHDRLGESQPSREGD